MGLPVLQMGFDPIVTCVNPLWQGAGGGDMFIPLSFLDQILSAEFFTKSQTKLFGR